MRLVGKVKQMEAARAKRASAVEAQGIVWTEQEELLERPLAAGEHLAVDVEVISDATGEVPAVWRTRERATRTPGDYGVVTCCGVRVGRVMAIAGGLLGIDYDGDAAEQAARGRR
ncbi:MAG TPA: hypothetical protein VFQ79_09155 [Bryobacteraceae bacterium]|nr:hypothetical protein [Bryobacteraceae bacterium]